MSTILIIKAYFDITMNFSIINLSITFILYIFCATHCFAIGWANFILFNITTLYLKYHFNQINDEMRENISSRISSKFINGIKRHHYYCRLTHEFNEFFKYYLLLWYFGGTVGVNLLLNIGFHSKADVIYRSIFIILGIIIGIALYMHNYSTSTVSSSAHKLRVILYSILCKNKLKVMHKLKICSYIEKLSGPKIAFYCYDLFPFTNYGFMEFIAFVSASYLLMNSFF